MIAKLVTSYRKFKDSVNKFVKFYIIFPSLVMTDSTLKKIVPILHNGLRIKTFKVKHQTIYVHSEK